MIRRGIRNNKERKILVVDFGYKHTGVALGFIKEGDVQIVQRESLPLMRFWSEEDTEHISQLEEAIKKLDRPNSQLILSIPRHLCMVRQFTLPTQEDEEIQQMIGFEAERHVPFSLEELEYDYVVLDKSEGESQIMLVAVQRDVLSRLLEDLGSIGTEPDKIQLSTFALLAGCRKRGILDDRLSCIVALDGSLLEVAISEAGKLLYTRGIPLREVSPSSISAEVERSFLAFRGLAGDVNFEKIIVLGEEDIAKDLSSRFPSADVVAAGDAEEVRLYGLLLLEAEEGGVNLIPQQIKQERRLQLQQERILSYVRKGALVVGALLFILLAAIGKTSYTLNSINRQIASFKGHNLSDLRSQVELLKSYSPEGAGALELLYVVSKFAPPEGLRLTLFDFKKGRSLLLEGESISQQEINALVEILNKTQYFSRVQLGTVRQMGKIWRFSIDCRIAGETQ